MRKTQRARLLLLLLLYRWMEMIVNDIHAHPLHCSSAVNNKKLHFITLWPALLVREEFDYRLIYSIICLHWKVRPVL